MKFQKSFLITVLALTFSFVLAACNNSKEVVSENSDSTKDLNESGLADRQVSEKSEQVVSASKALVPKALVPKALSSFSSEHQDAVKILREAEVGNGITVVDSGSGEKKIYSYSIPENSTANAEMKVKMGSSNVVNGQEVPSPPIPGIVTPMEFKTGKNEQGKVQVQATYLQARIEEDASVPDFLKEATLNQMNRLKDITMTWEVTSQGNISNVSFPDDLPPDLKSLFEQTQRSIGNMFVGLPSEAIGEKSSWILGIDSFNIGGIEQNLRILYQLTAIEGDLLSLDMTTRSLIEDQEFDLPGSGAKASAKAAENFTFGKMKVRLSSLIPNSEVSGDSKIVIEVPGSGQTIEATTSIEMEFKELPAEAAQKKAVNS